MTDTYVCRCGAHDSDNILGGLKKDGSFMQLCVRCANKRHLDVCHGSCLRWFDKAQLNSDGECARCATKEVA